MPAVLTEKGAPRQTQIVAASLASLLSFSTRYPPYSWGHYCRNDYGYDFLSEIPEITVSFD